MLKDWWDILDLPALIAITLFIGSLLIWAELFSHRTAGMFQ